MKCVLTGSLGNIGKPLATAMAAAGHSVTVVTRKKEKSGAIESIGAKAAIGSIEDIDFLSAIFQGADAAFTLVPPMEDSKDWVNRISLVGEGYAEAARASGLRNIVNLSSIGAHMASGCGPVSGLHHVEEALNSLQDTNVLHLRPGFFYTNFLSCIDMIRQKGFLYANYGSGTRLPLSHPADIAAVAAIELGKLGFRGKSARYVVCDEKTTDEIASLLGRSIGKPELKWVDRSDHEFLNSMLDAGVSPEIARNYVEMGAAVRSGAMTEEYRKSNERPSGDGISFEAFCPDFAAEFSRLEPALHH